MEKVEKFLPFVDNWAVCDTFSPKIFAKNKQKSQLSVKDMTKFTEESKREFV